jgi:hypothetical protein
MYSGTTLTPLSGRALGAHQKIDRLARSTLRELLTSNAAFPSSRQILHFEGINGPDAIKRKSPAKDEPWHYYSPFDADDEQLIHIIAAHYDELVKALKSHNTTRAAFESAWLAHAIVDGLTPAHHYPYEEKLTELRGGKGIESRTTIKEKLVMPGETRREQLHNNWLMWGPRGLLATHGMFELGIAGIIAPLSAKNKLFALQPHHRAELYEYGVLELFRRKAKEVASLDLYDRYQRWGWTPKLALHIRRQLLPTIVHMVTLAWYAAAIDAGLAERRV